LLWGDEIRFREDMNLKIKGKLGSGPSNWCQSGQNISYLIGPLYFANNHCAGSIVFVNSQDRRHGVKMDGKLSKKRSRKGNLPSEIFFKYGRDPPADCLCSSCKAKVFLMKK